MGFSIHWIGFFDFKSFEYREIPPPNFDELEELKYHIKQVREYDFESPFRANPNKCAHCIYSELCDNANLNIHAHP